MNALIRFGYWATKADRKVSRLDEWLFIGLITWVLTSRDGEVTKMMVLAIGTVALAFCSAFASSFMAEAMQWAKDRDRRGPRIEGL